jgi:hypothetical protein
LVERVIPSINKEKRNVRLIDKDKKTNDRSIDREKEGERERAEDHLHSSSRERGLKITL